MSQQEMKTKERGGWIAGIILIVIGLLAFLGQVVEMEWFGLLVLPTLALIFLVWGLVTRKEGLLIPAGILGGLGAGTLLMVGPYEGAPEQNAAGIFFLAFAGGWVAISLFSLLINRRMWWPLIPGAFLGLFGVALLGGETGLRILEVMGKGWPLILIAVGVYLIFFRKGVRSE